MVGVMPMNGVLEMAFGILFCQVSRYVSPKREKGLEYSFYIGVKNALHTVGRYNVHLRLVKLPVGATQVTN